MNWRVGLFKVRPFFVLGDVVGLFRHFAISGRKENVDDREHRNFFVSSVLSASFSETVPTKLSEIAESFRGLSHNELLGHPDEVRALEVVLRGDEEEGQQEGEDDDKRDDVDHFLERSDHPLVRRKRQKTNKT